MYTFRATLEIIGVNPYVFVPERILEAIFQAAQRDKGPIPVHGTVNNKPFTQTLVRFAGHWRLYINTTMLPKSPKRVGEILAVSLDFDARDRTLPLHPKLNAALKNNPSARRAFDALSPSRRNEINRYICNLKSLSKIEENVRRAISHLSGDARFVGRNPKKNDSKSRNFT